MMTADGGRTALDGEAGAGGAATMLGVYGEWAARALAARKPGYSFLDPRWEEVGRWSEEARAVFARFVLEPDLSDSFGSKPPVRLLGTREEGDLHIEELEWRLPFGPPTRAVFLHPRQFRGRLPGFLALHDHGGDKVFGRSKLLEDGADPRSAQEPAGGAAAGIASAKKAHLEEHRQRYYGGRSWAGELARRGHGVLVHDVMPFESRKIPAADLPAHVVARMLLAPGQAKELDPEDLQKRAGLQGLDLPEEGGAGSYAGMSEAEAAEAYRQSVQRYNAFASSHESILAKSIFCAGYTWPGITLAEDRFALEYLLSRPDIDPDRVGCGGLSGGGHRTNLLAGTDSRVACSFTAGFMTGWADFCLATSHTHTWMVYVPGLPRFLDYPDILSMRAPLPTLVLATRQDPLFSPGEVERAGRNLEAVWNKAGKPEAFGMRMHDGPHRFDLEMQEEAFAWLGRWM